MSENTKKLLPISRILAQWKENLAPNIFDRDILFEYAASSEWLIAQSFRPCIATYNGTNILFTQNITV